MKTLLILLSAAMASTAAMATTNTSELANISEAPPFYQKIIPGTDYTCTVDNSDPYDPALVITFGEYKGVCLDATTVRPPVLISEDANSIQVANFYHNGRFWFANIPKNAVTETYFQATPFDEVLFGLIKIAHNQFRFKLSQPIQLKAQAGDLTATDSLSEIIISSTVTEPANVAYSVFKSSSFGIVTRLLSVTSRAVEEISQDGSRIHQYRLQRPAALMNQYFQEAITKAALDAYAGRYRLLKENCLTRSFDAWDLATPPAKGVKRVEGHWWLIHDETEKPGLVGLKKRDVTFVRVNDMNTEVTCAKPGEMLGGVIVDPAKLGNASALCEYNSNLK